MPSKDTLIAPAGMADKLVALLEGRSFAAPVVAFTQSAKVASVTAEAAPAALAPKV